MLIVKKYWGLLWCMLLLCRPIQKLFILAPRSWELNRVFLISCSPSYVRPSVCTFFIFPSSSLEALGKFQANFVKSILGWRNLVCSRTLVEGLMACLFPNGGKNVMSVAKITLTAFKIYRVLWNLWPFSQKFLRSIMLVRENLRFCSFSQKFLREYLRVKSVVTLRQF